MVVGAATADPKSAVRENRGYGDIIWIAAPVPAPSKMKKSGRASIGVGKIDAAKQHGLIRVTNNRWPNC